MGDASNAAVQQLDVICVGEVLVDFLPLQPASQVKDVRSWERHLGGAPANVAVGAARLGLTSAMLGVVGVDAFGEFLREGLAAEGVDVSRLRQTDLGNTGLVFVSHGPGGERHFTHFRTRSADLFLGDLDVDPAFLLRSRALQFGTGALLYRDAQKAMIKMAHLAKSAGKWVVLDPNLRLDTWPRPNDLRRLLDYLLPSCTVVKLSEEEMGFVTSRDSIDQALVALKKAGVRLPIITTGARGATFLWNGKVVRVPAPKAEAVDTTGAGDGFSAGLLFGLLRALGNADALDEAGVGELRELVGFACAVGARVVERPGAVAGLPRLEELTKALPGTLRAALAARRKG